MISQSVSVDNLAEPIATRHWQEANAMHLNKHVQSSQWTLVEFWASDCIFSRLMKPVRTRLMKRYGKQFQLLRCGVNWEETHLDKKWGVAALPALVLFHNGKRVGRWISVTDAYLIMDQIDTLITAPVGEPA